MQNVTLSVQDRQTEVEVQGDALVVKSTTSSVVGVNASKQDLSKLHRATLEAYAQHLELDLDFTQYDTRGALVDAIIDAREGGK